MSKWFFFFSFFSRKVPGVRYQLFTKTTRVSGFIPATWPAQQKVFKVTFLLEYFSPCVYFSPHAYFSPCVLLSFALRLLHFQLDTCNMRIFTLSWQKSGIVYLGKEWKIPLLFSCNLALCWCLKFNIIQAKMKLKMNELFCGWRHNHTMLSNFISFAMEGTSWVCFLPQQERQLLIHPYHLCLHLLQPLNRK